MNASEDPMRPNFRNIFTQPSEMTVWVFSIKSASLLNFLSSCPFICQLLIFKVFSSILLQSKVDLVIISRVLTLTLHELLFNPMAVTI